MVFLKKALIFRCPQPKLSYGQRSKCADLLNRYSNSSSQNGTSGWNSSRHRYPDTAYPKVL